jgi:hypothetical protein
MEKLGVKPIRNEWINREGVCPLYAYAYWQLRREGVRLGEVKRIVSYMIEKFGLDFRNGFTAAMDNFAAKGYDMEPERNARYDRGYSEGELLRKHYWYE